MKKNISLAVMLLSLGSLLLLSGCSFQEGFDMDDREMMMDGRATMKNEDVDNNRMMMDDEDKMGMRSSLSPYSRDITGLSEAKDMEVIELNDGGVFALSAEMVKKKINGKMVKMMGYNGMIPGPLLKVKRGNSVTINFTNNTDEKALLHSHGIRMNNAFDGTALTQAPVPIGGSFRYEITFPDSGIYWYHPHLRGDYTQELGLYGNFLVQSEDPKYWSPVNKEIPLVLDDILLEDGDIAPFYKETANRVLMGRFGNTPFVNGSTNYQLSVNQGDVVRFYMTNVANTSSFQFSIPGAKMKLVGGDSGKFEQEAFIDSIIISPSERSVIEVYFPNSGTFEMLNKNPQMSMKLGSIEVLSGKSAVSYLNEFNTLRKNDDVISDIDPFREYFDKAVDKTLRLSIEMKGGMRKKQRGEGGRMNDNDEYSEKNNLRKIEWEEEMPRMNQMSSPDMVTWKLIDEDTGKENMDIDWTFKKGDVVKIKMINDADSQHPMQHPIHFHGQRFLVLSTNGIKNTNLSWEDTTLVKTGDTVEILMEMSNPGKWMGHCHIAEHLEADMMLSFEVTE